MEGVWRSDAPVTIFLDSHIEAPTRKIRGPDVAYESDSMWRLRDHDGWFRRRVSLG